MQSTAFRPKRNIASKKSRLKNTSGGFFDLFIFLILSGGKFNYAVFNNSARRKNVDFIFAALYKGLFRLDQDRQRALRFYYFFFFRFFCSICSTFSVSYQLVR